jgi:ATP-dependent Clp protease ATP-binding subunit ClpC
VFERFTEQARQVVVRAQDEAQELRHNYIGTEHLLLGVLQTDDGAGRVLLSLGVTADRARADVARIVGEGDKPISGQIPFTPRAKKVLELSLREARALAHDYIGPEHILLGLVREDEGIASQILRERGANADRVRDAVADALSVPRGALDAPATSQRLIAVRPRIALAAVVGFVVGLVTGRRSRRK